MSSIAEIAKEKYLTVETGYSSLKKPIATVTVETSNGLGYWNDSLYADIPDLVNDQFRSWYCDMFYKIGKDRVLTLIRVARTEGKNPARYFSHLLKQEQSAR